MSHPADEPMSLHIFRADSQPAHRFVVYLDERSSHLVKRNRRSLVRTKCCERQRWAGHCTAQVYYDGVYFFCRQERGCKTMYALRRKSSGAP